VTPEAPVPDGHKQVIIDSDGHDTLLTEIPDLLNARMWPGAMSRVRINRFVQRWSGHEWDLRQRQRELLEEAMAAREQGDTEGYTQFTGQTAGLIDSIKPAGEIVREVVAEAEEILRDRLPSLLRRAD
jgi:NAD(P)H-dependent flavin oxidoreductase YrpB (nitropropane dioxygenase family)